jgi:hypothetical protein
MDARKKMRWRHELELALGDAGEGALSVLEYRYVRYVERPHGLPAALRQQRIRQRTGNRYLDKRRDNWNLVHEDIITLRIGILDLGDRSCHTARDIATRLQLSGWQNHPHPCHRPSCAVSAS